MKNNSQNIQLQIAELKTIIENQNPRQEIKPILQKIEQQQQIIIELLQKNNKDNSLFIKETIVQEKSNPVTIDYNLLESLLKAKKWQEADQETTNIILTLGNKNKQGYLHQLDFNQLPSVDLKIIDQLWRDYSNNNFGFSLQKNLYQNLGGTRFFHQKLWQEFGEKMGWYQENNWLKYDQLNFTENAPEGHLPILGDGQIWFVGGWEGSFKNFSLFLEKLISCQLND